VERRKGKERQIKIKKNENEKTQNKIGEGFS
jgi:hypothetical protein